ncbi:hypothetical protein [Mycobacteroides sp. PCS013]|uniref:hypothetical protein n=1 Tax=Mycobacteroides sp. PCS013 TaxID=3074106 RepID=UPI003C2FA3E0
MPHRSTRNERKAIERAAAAGQWTSEAVGLFIRRYVSPDGERIADVRYAASGAVKAAVVYPRFGRHHMPVRLRDSLGHNVIDYIEFVEYRDAGAPS